MLLLNVLLLLQRSESELLMNLDELCASDSSVLIAAVLLSVPRPLNETEHLCIYPVMPVKVLHCLAAEVHELWRGVDEREEHVVRDFAEVRPRGELLVCLEMWAYHSRLCNLQ